MGMLKPILVLCVVISMFLSSSAQTCRSYTFTGNRLFSACNDLPVLNSFLHWTYNPANRTVNIAYRRPNLGANEWVSWAINPTRTGMLGAQCFVAFQAGGNTRAYTSPISSFATTLPNGSLSFPVHSVAAEIRNNEMTIFASFQLPGTSTTVNQVWQEGPLAAAGTTPSPTVHPTTGANIRSMGNIDFVSGQASGGGGAANARIRRRNIHGVLNAVSWGTLMPLGAVIARYLKVAKSANPAWFYLHIGCQFSAYVVGVAGWGTGLKLGKESTSVQYNPHRNIGIALFALGTLQVFALLLRPKPDHKYRLYWNIYHHLTGYTVIILSVVNIYKGFDILQPEDKWKRIYTGVIIAIGAIAVVLEALTWMVVIKRKQNEKKSPTSNGMNGYGHQQGV